MDVLYTGTIPSELSLITALKIVYLNQNSLTGTSQCNTMHQGQFLLFVTLSTYSTVDAL